jgi:hypothetical protein
MLPCELYKIGFLQVLKPEIHDELLLQELLRCVCGSDQLRLEQIRQVRFQARSKRDVETILVRAQQMVGLQRFSKQIQSLLPNSRSVDSHTHVQAWRSFEICKALEQLLEVSTSEGFVRVPPDA